MTRKSRTALARLRPQKQMPQAPGEPLSDEEIKKADTQRRIDKLFKKIMRRKSDNPRRHVLIGRLRDLCRESGSMPRL